MTSAGHLEGNVMDGNPRKSRATCRRNWALQVGFCKHFGQPSPPKDFCQAFWGNSSCVAILAQRGSMEMTACVTGAS